MEQGLVPDQYVAGQGGQRADTLMVENIFILAFGSVSGIRGAGRRTCSSTAGSPA
jgi:hypothetical protein